MRLGDVLPSGAVLIAHNSFVTEGVVYVTFAQALKAYRFGRRIGAALCKPSGQMIFAISREIINE